MSFTDDEKVKKKVSPVEDDDMVDLEKLRERAKKNVGGKKKSFLKKHPPLDEQQVEEKKRDAQKAKRKYYKDQEKIEKNLINYLKREEPIFNSDGEPIAWIRQIGYFELQEMMPDEIINELEDFDADKISPKQIKKIVDEGYGDYIFHVMEELITIPEHEWEWWKRNSTNEFISLFNRKLEEMMTRTGDQVNFL